MSKEELERIDRDGMAAWDQHSPEAFLDLFAEEFVWRDAGVPEPMTTREEAIRFMQSWFTAMPDMRTSTTNLVVGEDSFAGEARFEGTHTGPLAMGGSEVPATNRHVVGRGAYFVKVRDGKIVEFSSLPDAMGMMAQLGLLPQGQPA